MGQKGNNPLTPDNYDIKEIMSLLSNIEPLLYPGMKGNRPDIAYRLESGSVRNIFKVTKQAEAAFIGVMSMVAATQSIDSLELPSAKAIEQIQNMAVKHNYDFEFRAESHEGNILSITPTTKFYRSDALWVDAEVYFYGTLVDAGGKDKSNIHLETKDYGIQAQAKQNVVTGEIDRSSVKLLKIIDYRPSFDKDYLDGLIEKVGDGFNGMDVDEYISKIRGGYA